MKPLALLSRTSWLAIFLPVVFHAAQHTAPPACSFGPSSSGASPCSFRLCSCWTSSFTRGGTDPLHHGRPRDPRFSYLLFASHNLVRGSTSVLSRTTVTAVGIPDGSPLRGLSSQLSWMSATTLSLDGPWADGPSQSNITLYNGPQSSRWS